MLTHHTPDKATMRNATACPTMRTTSQNTCADADTTGSVV